MECYVVATIEEQYSTIEIEDRLEALAQDSAMIARILKAYGSLGCQGRAGLLAQDVFQQLYIDTLHGNRSWKRGISVDRHFIEAGRSIISNLEGRYQREVVSEFDSAFVDSYIATESSGDVFVMDGPDLALTRSQSDVLLAQWLKKVTELFDNDADAQCFIDQYLYFDPEKWSIISACNLTEATYNNLRKRIKDKVTKRFPSGIQWWELEK